MLANASSQCPLDLILNMAKFGERPNPSGKRVCSYPDKQGSNMGSHIPSLEGSTISYEDSSLSPEGVPPHQRSTPLTKRLGDPAPWYGVPKKYMAKFQTSFIYLKTPCPFKFTASIL